MRYRYLIHALSIFILFVFDFVIQAVFNVAHIRPFFFVSQLHFIGLVLYAREDSRFEILTKVLAVSFIMDLFHYKSYPVYYISYGLSILVVRFWHRHISDSYLEKLLMVYLAIFMKETLLFYLLKIFEHINLSYFMFLSNRSIWIILFSSLLLPLALWVYNFSEKQVRSYAHQHYQ